MMVHKVFNKAKNFVSSTDSLKNTHFACSLSNKNVRCNMTCLCSEGLIIPLYESLNRNFVI